jgi:hypothetical protein
MTSTESKFLSSPNNENEINNHNNNNNQNIVPKSTCSSISFSSSSILFDSNLNSIMSHNDTQSSSLFNNNQIMNSNLLVNHNNQNYNNNHHNSNKDLNNLFFEKLNLETNNEMYLNQQQISSNSIKYGELIVLGYNGCINATDPKLSANTRRKSKYVLKPRSEPNGVKPSTQHFVQSSQEADVRTIFDV